MRLTTVPTVRLQVVCIVVQAQIIVCSYLELNSGVMVVSEVTHETLGVGSSPASEHGCQFWFISRHKGQ